MSERPPVSDALVFFGATGDLAYKQIFPALQSMVRHGTLEVPVIGVAKAGWDLGRLKERAKDSLTAHGGVDGDAWPKLEGLLRYVDGDYADAATFQALERELGDAERPLHYLAIPPSLFGTVADGLASAGAAGPGARVVVEKPFGRDLASARELNRIIHRVFPEQAIFRIDHYLGKEAVQNLLYFRFANTFVEPIWSRAHVESIEITMAESFGVKGRGHFYEEAGAIRDVLQNHLIQTLAMLTMDPPVGHDAESQRDAKAALIRSLRPLRPDDVVRGQFRGYRDEDGVAPDSKVETYAAVRLAIDSWRWAGVPVLIRTGKELPLTATEVVVELRRPPLDVFDDIRPSQANRFRFRLGPEVTIAIEARAKQPGGGMSGEPVTLQVMHHSPEELPPYERLLGDAMKGDATLFARQDAVEAAWRVVDPILDDASPVYPYEPGTWGPAEATDLAEAVHGWNDPAPGGGSPA
ncbi:MAG: glucose-6-phosphate dehydrogenase [Solirubrobacteraceae bacterium]